MIAISAKMGGFGKYSFEQGFTSAVISHVSNTGVAASLPQILNLQPKSASELLDLAQGIASRIPNPSVHPTGLRIRLSSNKPLFT